jgi:general stress protein 26
MTTITAFAPEDLRAVAERMRDLDIAILTTRDGDRLASRPMSNNRQVEYDGDTWFFAPRDGGAARHVAADPRVARACGPPGRGTWVAMDAEAEIDDDPEHKRAHWFEELRQWFPDGPEDPGVVLLRARAMRIRAWGRDGDLDIQRQA